MAQKTRRKSKTREILSRCVLVTDCRGSVSVRIDHQRGRLPYREDDSTIEIRGQLSEPLDGVADASVMVFPAEDVSLGETTPPSVGSVTSTKPTFQVALFLPESEYSKLWGLVAANRVKTCDILFTQPYRRYAYIVNIRFSSALPDEDECS